MNEIRTTSTRPYLLRALHEWCTDNGLTPYLVVQADESVQVPLAFVQDGQIVLNASYDATSGLQMGNEFVHFKARFGGKPHEIMVPVGRVLAIYARETGQGMSFPLKSRKPWTMWCRPRPALRPAPKCSWSAAKKTRHRSRTTRRKTMICLLRQQNARL